MSNHLFWITLQHHNWTTHHRLPFARCYSAQLCSRTLCCRLTLPLPSRLILHLAHVALRFSIPSPFNCDISQCLTREIFLRREILLLRRALRRLVGQPGPMSLPKQRLTNITDEDLINRRRLGKTKLTVKPGQVGTSNATKASNLGPFEYAHLRAPLPEDLDGSEIFASQQNQAHPETYFLMVRSRLFSSAA